MDNNPTEPRILATRTWRINQNKIEMRQARLVILANISLMIAMTLLFWRGYTLFGFLVFAGEVLLLKIAIRSFSRANRLSEQKFYEMLDQMSRPEIKPYEEIVGG